MNPNYITMISHEEIVSIAEFSVEIGDISSWIKICIPYGILETIKGYLISTPSREDMDMREKWFGQLRERVSDVPLEVKAVLGKKVMSLREFLNVSENNVILVDRHVNDPIEIVLHERTKFKGKMGVFKGNKAVKIEEIIH